MSVGTRRDRLKREMALEPNMRPWQRRLFGAGAAASGGWAAFGGGSPVFYLMALMLGFAAISGF